MSFFAKVHHFFAQKTGKIHLFEVKNPTSTSQTDKESAFKREAVQFLMTKKPCRKSLTAGRPCCRSNVNYKLQTRLQDRGHVTFSGLRFSMKNLMTLLVPFLRVRDDWMHVRHVKIHGGNLANNFYS